MLGLASLSLLSLCGLTVAQDLGVPLNWRKFSNDRPDSEIISISEAAIDAILPKLKADIGEFDGIGYWQSGNVWASMANEDYRAGTSKYRDQVVSQLKNVFNLRANYDHVVTNDAANSGSLPTKNFGFQGSCDGKTMAGGVFWKTDPADNAINSITTTLYMTLSAYLGEATGDSKYISAAMLSANWVRDLNMKDNLVLDTIHANDCSRSPDNWLFTYNSGKFLEGLEILVDLTDDEGYRSLAANVANSAMKTGAWNRDDGVITEGASPNENNDNVGFKSILIRALDETYNRRKGDNEALRILIHSYVCVQMNALLDLAADGNNYSSAWAGPAQGFTTWGQMAALDVFVAAINAA
ncbi:glycoside hydrolase family 76 protein [Schizophyllum commune Loenen D]|nr:glycoside hydrolase family 76 protein [Schizophyllum commune Loenen D]